MWCLQFCGMSFHVADSGNAGVRWVSGSGTHSLKILTLLEVMELGAASDFNFSATARVRATRLGVGESFVHFLS
jgi:hypothetical protein